MAAREPCIIIGVDYGTTYTGVAFCTLTWTNGRPVASEIIPVTTWPGNWNEGKVPSLISYAIAPQGERQWGSDISESCPLIALTKLKLESQERIQELQGLLQALQGMRMSKVENIDQSNGLALAYTKDPEMIVADYLYRVREWLRTESPVSMRNSYDATFLDVTPIDLVITHPVGWSDEAKDRTLRAFREAGFDNSNPDFARLRKTIMISEPEAAALHVIRDLTADDANNTFRPRDCFILCDAGGGTVDLISYKILQVHPLKLEQVGLPTGALCGATFIDEAFQQWLELKLGEEVYMKLVGESDESAIGSHKTITTGMKQLMDDFESLKRAFSGEEIERSLSLPADIHELVEEDETKGIHDGEIRVTDKDLSQMFDPTVDRILELLLGQFEQVRHARLNVRHIFLSGGFGESPYLRAKVDEFARVRHIQRPEVTSPWLSVVYGAVTKGIEEASGINTTNGCRRNYGISTSQPFSAFKHGDRDVYTDPFDGEKKAERQMTWLIRKGEPLVAEEAKVRSMEICRKFGTGDSRIFRSTVVVCEDDYTPHRMADLHAGRIVTFPIEYDLSRIPNSAFQRFRTGSRGVPYFSANIMVEFRLQDTFQVRVTLNGEELSSITRNIEGGDEPLA